MRRRTVTRSGWHRASCPPVNAFWSLTMYELPASLLVANLLNRYLINSPMRPQLKKDADGGITLHVQNESPGADRESSWLPAPKGPFIMYMRLYWPKQEALSGAWKQPPLQPLPGAHLSLHQPMNRRTENMKTHIVPIVLALLLASTGLVASAAVPVTVDNFCRAETDETFARYARQGGFGKMFHIRTPTPIDRQDVIRMNRDTLYSAGVFDLTAPVTVVKPDSGGRFQSMLVINQDHSMLPVEHGPGRFTFTKEKIGTRYVMVVFRTFVDADNPDDIRAANALQDRIATEQGAPGTFEIPEWDQASLHKLREAIKVLAFTMANFNGCFGDKSKIDPVRHLLGTAAGWGGNPDHAARYDNVVPEKNDGKIPHSVTVTDVPVDGFWSITVYNKDGYMEKNEQNAYSFNNVTAKKNPDGSITINFGGGPDAVNNLPITPGWNYAVRMYQPRAEIISGGWSFPRAQPVR